MRSKTGAAILLPALMMTLGLWLSASPATQPAVHAPAGLKSLPEGLDWALAQGQHHHAGGVFYVGYLVPRKDSGDLKCVRSRHHPGKSVNETTLEELVYGKKTGGPVSKDRHEPIAVILKYPGVGRERQGFEAVEIHNLFRPVEPAPVPLYWLGNTTAEHSTAFLRDCFKKKQDRKLKETLLAALGIHGPHPVVFETLEEVLVKQKEAEALREKAAFWMGMQRTPAAAGILMKSVLGDPSGNVREHAVFGLSQARCAEADDFLVQLAKTGKDKEVRKTAVFWLGQKAVERLAETLEQVAEEDPEDDVKEAAVFALSRRKDGVTRLLRLAKNHDSFEVRRHALFWLGRSGDPRGLELILEILEK